MLARTWATGGVRAKRTRSAYMSRCTTAVRWAASRLGTIGRGEDIVVGIEADYDLFSDLNFGTVRGRFGFLANNVLVYGTAGVAFADSGPDNVVGLVIGAGAEMPVWRNTTIGLEALYYNFEEQSGTINTGFGTVHYSADADTFVIRGRLNYHFN